MAKTKTSAKQKRSSPELEPFDPTKGLKNPMEVVETLLWCLSNDDLESFQDVLVAHLRTVNKSRLAAQTKIGRQTLYDLMDPEKPFNPTLETIAPLIKAIKAA